MTTTEDLKYSQIKDKIKDEYCKDKNIKLIRISYIRIGMIQQILEKELYG
jgi:hypothetical protein